MGRVTATEARRNLFQLLDQALEGKAVIIERNGRSIVLKAHPARRVPRKHSAAAYRKALGEDATRWIDEVESWTWEWRGPGKPMKLVQRKRT
jgi:antitoxin (DNA-binding transcriptional repressor) of toxin-antitoxin stability system